MVCLPIFTRVRQRDCGPLVESELMCAPQQWVQVESLTSSVSNSCLNCIYQIKRSLAHLGASAIRGHRCGWQLTGKKSSMWIWLWTRAHRTECSGFFWQSWLKGCFFSDAMRIHGVKVTLTHLNPLQVNQMRLCSENEYLTNQITLFSDLNSPVLAIHNTSQHVNTERICGENPMEETVAPVYK